MPITAVVVGGDPIDLDGVLADVTIRHGRAAIGEDADASSALVTLLGLTRPYTTDFRVGVSLELEADGEPRFTGTITDAGYDAGALTLVGIGMLATYGPRLVPAWSGPAESWGARVTRVFTAAGLASVLVLEPDPAFNPGLIAGSGDGTRSLAETVLELCDDVGALFCDLPDGRILVQAVGARTGPPLELDPEHVLYAPAWAQTLEPVNVVTVVYGSPENEVTVTDAASVALYGEQLETIETAIAVAADATTRATERTARAAHPRWYMPACPLVVPYELELGGQVRITELPDDAPAAEWEPIVEGWEDTIVGPDWTMLVSLSDPLFSGLVLTWASTPTDIAWADVDPGCSWLEATSASSLT